MVGYNEASRIKRRKIFMINHQILLKNIQHKDLNVLVNATDTMKYAKKCKLVYKYYDIVKCCTHRFTTCSQI